MPSNLRPVRDIAADWRPGDAVRLARLWNEMDSAWPGGWGEPNVTPQEAEREFRSRSKLAAFVAEAGGQFVSYADLQEGREAPHNCYVGLLTARLDYHGRGFGKAVLLACVEKAFELGYPRVTLGTWAGNTKAVPLYKKSGFMWVPDTHHFGVHMENFTPFARQHPVGREFFADHDWYDTLKRDPALKEDLHKRGKVKAFPYEWRSPDGRFLRMVFDPQSWGLLEIETNEFRAGCFLPDEKLVCGLPHAIRWDIVNRTREPLPVELRTSSDRGISLDFSRSLVVAHRATLQARFVVDPELPEKRKPPRVPIITTRLRLGGKSVELKAGFQARQPISLDLEQPTPCLVPGQPQRVFFHVRSRLDAKATAALRLDAGAGSSVRPRMARLSLAAKGTARLPVTAWASRSGTVSMSWTGRVSAAGRRVRPRPGKLALLARQPLECAGLVERDRVTLQSASMKISIPRHTGYVHITRPARADDQGAGLWNPSVGPPFLWGDFFRERCKASIERAAGKVTAILETESGQMPGIWLRRRITLGNEPVAQVVDWVENRSGTAHSLSRQFGGHARIEGHRGFTAPVDGRIVSDREGGRELGDFALRDEAAAWPEGWVAWHSPAGLSAGILWRRAERIECGGWGCRIETPLGRLAPGESKACEPVFVYLGEGDPAEVRRWWLALFAPGAEHEAKPDRGHPITFGVEPYPLVVARRETACLKLSAVGKKELEADVRLTLPRGFTPRRIERKGRKFGRAGELLDLLTVRRQQRVKEGVYQGELTLDDGDFLSRRPVPVVALGSGKGSIRAAAGRDGLYRINNGSLLLTVAPSFAGCAVALERGGVNHLRSGYPKAGPMAWWNPWHGGISPVLENPEEQLHKRRCRAELLRRKGTSGTSWRGVRLTWDRKREDLGGVFRYQAEYLLAPGSSIVAVAVRCQQRGIFPVECHAGLTLWPSPGGSHLDAMLRGAADPQISRRRTDFGAWTYGGTWLLAENPRTGDALMMIACNDDPVLRANVVGQDGYLFEAHSVGRLQPGEAKERIYYLVLAPSSAEAEPFAALSACRGLM